jgi:hypothetical protein
MITPERDQRALDTRFERTIDQAAGGRMPDHYDLFHRETPGRFYRGNLHTHSSHSDGGMPLDAVCRAYRQQGYDFLAVTDHFRPQYGYPIVDTRPYRTDAFTTLIGAELHAPALENGQPWHMLGIGLPFDFAPPSDTETGPELAQRAVDAGAFLVLAHPEWYGASVDDLESMTSAHAVETYNEVCGRLNDRASSWTLYDRLLSDGRKLLAVGGDDAHFRHVMTKPDAPPLDVIATGIGEDAPAGFGCWVWVRSPELSPEALLAALKEGDFYTSQGPIIHDIRISEDRSQIHVVNSPVVSAFATGPASIVQTRGKHGVQITNWSAPIDLYRGSFVRVTIVDAFGKRAWSNPIWLD